MHLGYAEGRKQKYSESEKKGLFRVHGSCPWGLIGGRAISLTLTRKA
jgi:hypothetical protein